MVAKGSLELAGYQPSFGSAGNPVSKERSGKWYSKTQTSYSSLMHTQAYADTDV